MVTRINRGCRHLAPRAQLRNQIIQRDTVSVRRRYLQRMQSTDKGMRRDIRWTVGQEAMLQTAGLSI